MNFGLTAIPITDNFGSPRHPLLVKPVINVLSGKILLHGTGLCQGKLLPFLFVLGWFLSSTDPITRVGKVLYVWFMGADEIADIHHSKIRADGHGETQRMGGASGAAEEAFDDLPIFRRGFGKIVFEKPPEQTQHLRVERRLGYVKIVAVRGVVEVVEKGLNPVDDVVSLIELPEEPEGPIPELIDRHLFGDDGKGIEIVGQPGIAGDMCLPIAISPLFDEALLEGGTVRSL